MISYIHNRRGGALMVAHRQIATVRAVNRKGGNRKSGQPAVNVENTSRNRIIIRSIFA